MAHDKLRTKSQSRWCLSEFFTHLDVRGQTWCFVEIGAAGGFSIPHNNEVYFYAVLEGQVRVAGATHKALCLEQGDIAIVLSDEAHTLRTEPGSPAQIIEYLRDGSWGDVPPTIAIGGGPITVRVLCGRLKIRWPGGLRLGAIPPLLTIAAGETMVSMADLRRCATGAGSAGLLTQVASMLLTLALQRYAQRSDLFPALANDDPISRAVQLIELHADVPWTVAMLATKVGMGRSSFAARFTDIVGQTPMELLAERRMDNALWLLRHPSLKITDIAERVGYHSVAAFIRRFGSRYGMTPGQMRATMEPGDGRERSPLPPAGARELESHAHPA